ncbi:MAG: ABC transporter permease [Pelosinus sp.]|nr:ABC transporter permease [Pelosinus sp.]
MLQLLWTECKALVTRQRSTLLILFGIPIVYTLLFGALYSSNVIKYMPLVIYDQDQTSTSRTLVQAFADSERYNIVAQVTAEEDLDYYLHNNKAMAALIIPTNFSQDIKLSRSADVLLDINATNLMFGNNVLSSSQEILQMFVVGAGQKLLEAAGQPPAQALNSAAPVRLGVRIINNPTVSYSNFVLAGLSMNGLQLAIYLVSCTLLTAEYTALARRRDLSSFIIMLSKLLPCWLLSVISYLLTLGVLINYFEVPCRGSFTQLLLIGSAFTFAMSTLGLFISSITPNVLMLMQNSAIYIMCSFLCCGYSWPEFAMNSFGQFFAKMLPITYAAVTVRDILLCAYAPDLEHNLIVLTTLGSSLFLLSILTFKLRRKKFAGEEALS